MLTGEFENQERNTMRTMKLAIPAMVLMTGFLVCTTSTYAKPEYSKKTSKNCVYCHTKMGAKDLNATGTCYKDNNHSLDTCKAPADKK
jgi:hypothetical protein